MTAEEGRISPTRFMFLIACLIQASSLLTSFLVVVARRDSWIVAIAGALVGFALMGTYGALIARFPGKDLIQIFREVFGGFTGGALGVLYVWFFVTLSTLNLGDMADLVNLSLLHETPPWAVTITCVLIAVWAVRYGIRVVARYGPLFAYGATILTVISTILIADQIALHNLIPTFEFTATQYAQGLSMIVTIPFGELVTLLMISPSVRIPPKQVLKYLLGGFAIGATTVIVILTRNIAVLGDAISLFSIPSLVALRIARVGRGLGRTEILFAIAFVPLLFFKVMVFLYVSCRALAETFKLRHFKHLALALGALIIVYSVTLYPNPVEHARAAGDEVTIMWTFFEVLVPIIVLIVAKARGLPKDVPKG